MRAGSTGGREVGRADRERGASLVEFALVLPMLTVFLFAIVQFGIAYDKQQSINSAAREGARLGALEDTTLEQIATRAIGAYGASASAGDDPLVEVYDDTSASPVGTRAPDGTYSTTGTSTASPTPSQEDDATLMPCGRETPSAFIRVIVSTPYDITIPFWGVHAVTIDSEAQFRCE